MSPAPATRARRTGAANRGEWQPAESLPVARVAVDVPLAHLDRPFDYRVPTHLDRAAQPGVRIRVRFSGRLVDGYLLERADESAHTGKLAWVEKVVSAEPVLTPEVAALCRAVADRYAGVMADVLRLAVPPRHAKAEAEAPRARDVGPVARPAAAAWGRYPRGSALLDALAGGRAAHAVWQPLPGEDWAARLAEAAAATVSSGRGALLVVPDQRDVAALHTACAALVGADAVVALTAEVGPAERYRRWLAVRRGQVPLVVGTRSAAFAPVPRLGLLAVWDDGDDLHAEPRAPYPQVRDVLVLRAHSAGAALLVGGFARTAEAHLLVEAGWASEVVAGRTTVRAAMPRVLPMVEDEVRARHPDEPGARLQQTAFDAARAALAAGRPVLVQVPRAGYLPWLACGSCRETARCRHCAGPLALVGAGSGAGRAPAGDRPDPDAAGLPRCRWCGRTEAAYRCAGCGSRRLRAGVIGSRRTAEELGRAFPGTPVRPSGGGAPVVAEVPATPALVVATPGAEPRVAGGPAGYGAALLLDGWALLSRPDLRVAEEALRRWLAAAALVVPHGAGGRVVIAADPALPAVQALLRWDPAWHAGVELAGRTEVGFPPAVRMAAVDGGARAVAEVLAVLPPEIEVLGPVELDEPGSGPATAEEPEPRERALLRVPRPSGKALGAALHAAQAARSTRKATDPVRIRLDPVEIG